VSHDSRVHLDIESDDVEAEVARLQKLGARRLDNVKTWVVLEAPTGQRFCVIRARSPLEGKPDAQVWK
jgi:hypothetical protein